MNVLIQESPKVNLTPLIHCISDSLTEEVRSAVFSDKVDPQAIIAEMKPDIIFFCGDTVNQNVADLLNNSSCAKFEHQAVEKESKMTKNTFSFSDRDHAQYFPPMCHSFILSRPQRVDKFIADISFVGPPTPNASDVFASLLDADSDFHFKIYGENRYHNWRYCGLVKESDIKDIYRSSKIVPVFNSELEYDFRVLDCIFAGGVPLCEKNDSLISRFGSVMEDMSFTRETMAEDINRVMDNLESIKESLVKVREAIVADYTWYGVAAHMFKGIGLKKTAMKIETKRGEL